MLNTKESQCCETQNQHNISKRDYLREIMRQAWQFVKRNGFTLREALKQAWALYKLKIKMRLGIVKFHYTKISGEVREAYGTLYEKLMPAVAGTDNRKKNDTVQVYYDTEKQEFRCFKRANLVINPLN